MTTKDFYSVLGVSKTASQDEIKQAYRKLAKTHHPDVNKTPGSDERFKEISEAYSVLGDEEKRRNYDNPASHGFGEGFTVDFGHFHKPRPRANSHVNVQIQITAEDSLKKEPIAIEYNRSVACPDCKGKGGDGDAVVCGDCQGQGYTADFVQTQFGRMQIGSFSPCKRCRGKGRTSMEVCAKCSGFGLIDELIKESVTMVGFGGAYAFSAGGNQEDINLPPGQAIVQPVVAPHKDFKFSNDFSVHYVAKIDPVIAMLGGSIKVPTIDQVPLHILIPQGTCQGLVEIQNGKGLPKSDGGRGAMHIYVEFEIPKSITESQNSALREYLKNK